MLPSPPGTHVSLAPLSPPTLDLEPSPSYSPLSSPSTSPKPPPSPPPSGDSDGAHVRTKLWEREREIRELKKKLDVLQREKLQREAADVLRSNSPSSSRSSSPINTTTTTTANTATADPGGLSADSIALRSTLRLLMLQRDRAKRDIGTLEQMREDALREPLEFVNFIQSQKRGGRPAPTAGGDKKQNIFAGRELPKPQEIYRCPPIEWSQYRILGAPLDALHEKQRRRASPSRPVGAAQGAAAAAGVPPSMQTGGIIGMPPTEYGEDPGMMQGRMRLFDGIGQRGGVVGR